MIIYRAGTGKSFTGKTNKHWVKETRPIIEAYFHAMYFLEMAIKYGQKQELIENINPITLEERFSIPPLGSGMAVLLSLFDM
jgi:hypothetical protein